MRTRETFTCPVCEEETIEMEYFYHPGSYYDPPETSCEIAKQDCDCKLSDADEKWLQDTMLDHAGDPWYGAPEWEPED